MSAHDKSGAAFPELESLQRDRDNDFMAITSGGLTQRQYFAAHAPDVPDWFRYKADNKPVKMEVPDPERELRPIEQAELGAWTRNNVSDFSVMSRPVQEFMVRWQKATDANKKFHEWTMRSREEKYWAWRWYYADKMIEGSMT